MQQTFEKYLSSISEIYKSGKGTEYTYRTPIQNLLQEIFTGVDVRQETKTDDKNKPDFVVYKNNVPLVYIETKDIGTSLDKVEKSSQMSRYFGYGNLVLTDYLEFRFYRNGLPYVEPIIIGKFDKKDRSIKTYPDQFQRLFRTLTEFTQSYKEPIKSGLHLAKIMGGKAQRIRDNTIEVLKEDSQKKEQLAKIFLMIKDLLVHDLNTSDFSDMYAQTLVYGLFVARYYDNSENNFTRQEARDLIPESNPFLRDFFDHITGTNFDKRLEPIVNELCEVFSHADVKKLMEDYYKKEDGKDPVIHFYEDFLNEYDPDLRRRMGAYYTPQPVVNFIVRSVDHILKKDFNITEGLVDSSKYENGQHKVQVLDPAVGTGTFLSTTLNYIYGSIKKSKKPGRWDGTYIHHNLLPRIHGFELMMTPYTIAHLKISMAFAKTGFKHFSRRFGIYLTNSLEKISEQQEMYAFGLAESISKESKEANNIKVEAPIMVVLGNPPYSVSSSNKGEWIEDLVKEYKKNLKERNIQPLSDDYIKFIRFSENLIEKNGTGIVAMITNNSFIDGIIHRQMRKNLLETFDDIYILNLHGNSRKGETSPDGTKDENVFDIMAGVSINVFVRKNRTKKLLGKVHHMDLYGMREKKFEFLTKNSTKQINWNVLDYKDPYYFFVPKDFSLGNEYNKNFSINTLFTIYTSGVKTHNDAELVSIKPFEENNHIYTYRSLDNRFIDYNLEKVLRHRFSKARHMLDNNLSLLTTRQLSSTSFQHVFITTSLSDIGILSARTKESSYIFPLYLYSEDGTKTPNLNTEIVKGIEEVVGKTTPENIFDYIYAILHSPKYREKYKEFLKIDFPRVPYPKNKESFKKLVKIGTELRELHLMETEKLEKNNITYPISGTGKIAKITYKDNKVYINEDQYFGNVSEIAWNFYIGGYQPAQKWLKDRKEKILTSEDIDYYAKILTALEETDRIMKEIDKIIDF